MGTEERRIGRIDGTQRVGYMGATTRGRVEVLTPLKFGPAPNFLRTGSFLTNRVWLCNRLKETG